MARRLHATTALLLLLAAAAPAGGHKFSLSVSGDTRRVMDLGVFGIDERGAVEVVVTTMTLDDKGAEQSGKSIGFTVDRVATALHARQEKNYGKLELAHQGICFIDDDAVRPDDGRPQARTVLPLQDDLPVAPSAAPVRRTVQVSQGGLYALFFYNCKRFANASHTIDIGGGSGPPPRDVPVTFDVAVSMYNVDAKGGIYYSSFGESNLPEVFLGFAVVYLVLLAYWMRVTLTAPRVVSLHHLITLLLCVTVLTLVCRTGGQYHLRRHGVRGVWSGIYYVLLTLRGVLLFTVILLIGTGWSIVKPYLTEKDRYVLMAVVPLQILVHIAISYIETTSEGDMMYTSYSDMLMILDTACCVSVVLPVTWSIKQLNDALNMDGKEAQNLSRLRQFRMFYVVVVAYLYFTRIVVPFVKTLLPYSRTYLAPALAEAAALAFAVCAFTSSRFAPGSVDMAETPPQGKQVLDEEADTNPLRGGTAA